VVDALDGQFRTMPVAEQRDVVRALVVPTVLPAERATNRFDPSRIRFDWKV